MLIKAAESERIIARFPVEFEAALLFGPDQGLVRERAERLAKTVVPDLRDPFRIAEIEGARLIEDPAWLEAEASAISMTGGRRVVRIRGAGNALAPVFDSFLARSASDALVVVEGGDLARNSSLRETFEEASNAAAIPCYLDSTETIADLLRASLKAESITIAPDALDEAVSLLGA